MATSKIKHGNMRSTNASKNAPNSTGRNGRIATQQMKQQQLRNARINRPRAPSTSSSDEEDHDDDHEQTSSSNGDNDDVEPAGDDDDEGSDDSADEEDASALSNARRKTPASQKHLAGQGSDDLESLTSTMDDDDDNDDSMSDEEYGAVEELSDSDDSIAANDEKKMLRSTEQQLIEEFEYEHEPRASVGMQAAQYDAVFRRPSLVSEDSRLNEYEAQLDFSMDPFGGLDRNDDNYRELLHDAEDLFGDDNLASWRSPGNPRMRQNSMTSATQKRVRFDTTPSRASSTSSTSSDEDPEDVEDVFPDLFSALDNPLQSQPIYDTETAFGGNVNADNESVYDFEDEYAVAENHDDDSDLDGSEASFSESESNGGETTDEETMDEQVARMTAIRKAAGKSPPSAAKSAPATPIPRDRNSLHRRALTARMSSASASKELPKAGTFTHDPSKAIVVADSSGNGIRLICPTKPPAKDREYWERARKVIGSRDGSPNGPVSWTKRTPRTPAQQPPLTARATLGTLFNGNLNFLRDNDHAGIANSAIERATPHRPTYSRFTSANLTETETSDNDSNINMADFIEMDDSDSEMGADSPMVNVMSPSEAGMTLSEWNMQSSPVVRHEITSGGLLDHFDQQRGLVSSFRNNQHHARHFSSLPSHPARRAQMSENNALQKGRRNAANTPMTPLRKKRPSQDLTMTGAGVRKAAASPLAARHHRRSRGSSLSGMAQTLALDHFGPSTEDRHM